MLEQRSGLRRAVCSPFCSRRSQSCGGIPSGISSGGQQEHQTSPWSPRKCSLTFSCLESTRLHTALQHPSHPPSGEWYSLFKERLFYQKQNGNIQVSWTKLVLKIQFPTLAEGDEGSLLLSLLLWALSWQDTPFVSHEAFAAHMATCGAVCYCSLVAQPEDLLVVPGRRRQCSINLQPDSEQRTQAEIKITWNPTSHCYHFSVWVIDFYTIGVVLHVQLYILPFP